MRVGQMQLIRNQIANQLSRSAKFDSKLLVNSLQTFNQALLSSTEAHYRDPTNPYPGENNDIMFELTPYLETAGLSDPLSKVGDTNITKRLDNLTIILELKITLINKFLHSYSLSLILL
jgi:WASH complex subunit strumpellin